MGAWGEVLGGTETALNSTGGATERMAIYTESLEGKLKTLQATWEEFVLNLQASDAFKFLIDLGTKLISVLDLLLNKIPILSNLIKTVLVVGAINVLAGSIRNLITMMGNNGILGGLINFGSLATNASNAVSIFAGSLSAGTTAGQAFGNGLSALIPQLSNVISAIGKFISLLGPAGIVTAVGVAGLAIVGGLVTYFNSAEKAAKDAEKAIGDFNEKQQNLETAQSQLDTINDKIAEINAKDGLTLTDKQELINLKEQRAELESIIALKKQAALSSAKEAAPDIQKAFTKSYGSDAGQVAQFGEDTAIGRLQTASQGLGGFSAVLGAYKELTRRQEEAAAGASEFGKAEQEALDTATEKVQDAQEELTGYRDTLQNAKDLMSDKEWQDSGLAPLLDDLNTQLSAIEQVTAPEAWKGHKLTELLLGDDASQTVKDAESQLEELSQKFADGLIDEDAYKEKMLQLLTNIANDPDIQEGLKSIFPDLDLSDKDAVLNTLAETLGYTIPNAATTAGEYIKQAFDDSIESVDHMSEVADEFVNKLSGIDLSTVEGLHEAMDGAVDIMYDADAALQSYQDDIDNMQSGYDSLVSSMNGMSEAADFIASNMDVLSGSTTVTAEGFQKLVDTASGISYINAETGETVNLADALGISLNEDGTVAVSAQGGIQGFIGELQQNANATTAAMEAIVTAINQVRAALGAAATSAANWAKNVSGTLSKFNIGGIADGAIKMLDGFADKATSIADSMDKAIKDSTTSSKKQIQDLTNKFNAGAGNAQKQYKKIQDAANKAGKSGSGSTKKQTDATKELTDALKEEYEAQKAILDAQKKQLQARKEALAQEKSDLADAKEAIQDLVDMTMKMLKQEYQNRVDILEKQIDALEKDLSDQQDKLEKAYNKQTEALENQLDAFNEKIEAQKEYLKLQKEEQEHAEELSEKNQAIADVQAQLEELRYDNSAAAQKKRLELLDELNGAQKDLTDYQNQYDYDTKVDGLDKEQSAFQQQIENEKNALKDRYDQEKQQIEDTYNAKIDALNKEKDYIKNTLMEEYNLYQEAINLIQSRSDDLYNRLVEWNRVKLLLCINRVICWKLLIFGQSAGKISSPSTTMGIPQLCNSDVI